MSEWEDWVKRTTRGATSRQVADRIGHSHTTALKWMHDGASVDAVISLAIAYDADPIQAMVAAGWLKRELVGNLNLDGALKRLSSVKLAGELYRRAREHEGQAGRAPDVFDGHDGGM